MKAKLRRTLSTVLVISMLVAVMPVAAIAEAAALAQAASYLQGLATAQAAGQDLYTLDNGYIKVTVSAENGGFAIWTQDGDRLNKDDNNKSLLYHSGEYDTSFTSFQVTYPDGKVKEYLFGGLLLRRLEGADAGCGIPGRHGDIGGLDG